MTTLVTDRFRRLADTLGELKVRVRTALAAELADAVGAALRDVLVAALIDRLVAAPSRAPARTPAYRSPPRPFDDRDGRDPWGERKDRSSNLDEDAGDDRYRPAPRRGWDESEEDEEKAPPSTSRFVAAAVGVHVGRWWLSRNGTPIAATGVGLLVAALGLAGGPVARALLGVLATAADLLTAESALARPDPS